jgi:SurA N-terminal domain
VDTGGYGGSLPREDTVLGKRSRRVTALGVAGLGACALLAACSPVKVGSAAIVGDQRITVSALDTQVSNLQAAAKPLGAGFPLTAAQTPQAVLSWLIRFSIMDQAAASEGVSVSAADVQAGVASIDSQAQSAASQEGLTSASAALLAAGVSPQMVDDIGRYQAQLTAYATKVNGGKLPSTDAQNTTVNNALTKAQCDAAKSLNIQVSPQFGRLDYSQYAVVAAPNTLSRPAGTPTAASTAGLAPAC